MKILIYENGYLQVLHENEEGYKKVKRHVLPHHGSFSLIIDDEEGNIYTTEVYREEKGLEMRSPTTEGKPTEEMYDKACEVVFYLNRMYKGGKGYVEPKPSEEDIPMEEDE